jgi:hypothetical protein
MGSALDSTQPDIDQSIYQLHMYKHIRIKTTETTLKQQKQHTWWWKSRYGFGC